MTGSLHGKTGVPPASLSIVVIGSLLFLFVACEPDCNRGSTAGVNSTYRSRLELLLNGKTQDFLESVSWDELIYERSPGIPLYAMSVMYLSDSELARLVEKYPQLRDHRSSTGDGLLHYYCQDVGIAKNKDSILLLLNAGFDWQARNRSGEDARDCLRVAYERSIQELRRPPKTLRDGSQDVSGYSEKDLRRIYDQILCAMVP